ncbi:MAG TPA: branched-chain amino acid ABC transporter substrate-binding protein [Candidatus Paceibacterota bacterium]
MKKIIWAILAAIILVLAVWGWVEFKNPGTPGSAGANLESQNKIKIVTSYPMGYGSGRLVIDAVNLAFEQIGYKVGKYSIELVSLDDGDKIGAWQEDMEEKNARIAAEDPDVMAYIGPFNSGAAKVSMPILNRAGITQISIGNTWPGLTKSGFAPGEPGIFYPTGIRHYFRIMTTDDLQGPAGAVWAEELGFKKIYIIDDGEVYGKGIADLFHNKAIKLGLQILDHRTIDKKSSDFRELILGIKKLKPDLIYYGGVTPNGITYFLPQMHELGLKTSTMGPDGIMEQDFIDRTGPEYTEGVMATTVGVDARNIGTPGAEKFYNVFFAKYGKDPGAYGAFAYEAAKALIRAIAITGQKNRAAILDNFRNIKYSDGVLESWNFDQNGDTTLKIISGSKVINGKFETVKKFQVN